METSTLASPGSASYSGELVRSRLSEKLDGLRASGQYRTFIASDNITDWPGYARCEDQTIAVWCSNDYLGLGQHPAVVDRTAAELRAQGVGAGGSRNISGTAVAHALLEKRFAEWHEKEAALLFSSGYVANFETISVLRRAIPELVVYSDRLNHRSLIEGIRRHPGETHVFRHNDVEHLRSLLLAQDPARPKLIVLESIYSMDADLGPVSAMCDLAEEFGALTYIDETHAIGIRGPGGAGLLAELGETRATFVQGVAGKALGTVGGYVAGPRDVIDFVRSTAPGFIFTTALPPAVVAGTDTALSIVQGGEGDQLRNSLSRNVALLKGLLSEREIPFLDHDSHFVPVLVSGARRVKAVAQVLRSAHNVYVQPINAPSVPVGTERFRLAPGPYRTADEIYLFVNHLDGVLRSHPVDGLDSSLREERHP
ncbi:5-aminolevulinate synthase [Actinoplanes sp. NPDC051859]|uniref:5-aminolevulinate synthase n=1 Tax=Actinoplanes sp. NPDC051859 TaxID=3363909 RepID=UPI0037BACE3B